MIEALIPWPPSVNSMYRSIRGRNILSKPYREWIDIATKALIRQDIQPIEGPVSISIRLHPPSKRLYDLDNRVKPILDLFHKCGYIDDDNSKIVKQLVVWEGKDGENGAWVSIEPIGELNG